MSKAAFNNSRVNCITSQLHSSQPQDPSDRHGSLEERSTTDENNRRREADSAQSPVRHRRELSNRAASSSLPPEMVESVLRVARRMAADDAISSRVQDFVRDEVNNLYSTLDEGGGRASTTCHSPTTPTSTVTRESSSWVLEDAPSPASTAAELHQRSTTDLQYPYYYAHSAPSPNSSDFLDDVFSHSFYRVSSACPSEGGNGTPHSRAGSQSRRTSRAVTPSSGLIGPNVDTANSSVRATKASRHTQRPLPQSPPHCPPSRRRRRGSACSGTGPVDHLAPKPNATTTTTVTTIKPSGLLHRTGRLWSSLVAATSFATSLMSTLLSRVWSGVFGAMVTDPLAGDGALVRHGTDRHRHVQRERFSVFLPAAAVFLNAALSLALAAHHMRHGPFCPTEGSTTAAAVLNGEDWTCGEGSDAAAAYEEEFRASMQATCHHWVGSALRIVLAAWSEFSSAELDYGTALEMTERL